MALIKRNPSGFEAEAFDLIIVGGGIYGIMLSLESGFRGKRALLLEKNDFGSATTYNHLRTLHGGLRYLQALDFKRFFESVGERHWFFMHFPQLLKALPCLMPLYEKGLRRTSILKVALKINDSLSRRRNQNVVAERHLPDGYIVGPEKVKRLFPSVDPEGLGGGAIWYDGMIMEPERLVTEVLLWSKEMGTCPLNYVKADALVKEKNCVAGLKATDTLSGNALHFKAPVVVNAAGPWCREVARAFDRDFASLFPSYLLLWNILFKREALSDCSLAVSPEKGKGHTYFIHNWKGRMLAGTGEAPVQNPKQEGVPTTSMIESFIRDLNRAIPSLAMAPGEIDHVYYGLLPADSRNNLTKREVILDHERFGGPKGLFSVSGIKFTTSRLVAQKTLDMIFPDSSKTRVSKKRDLHKFDVQEKTFAFDWLPDEKDKNWKAILDHIIEEEFVVHLDDLIFRRTSLGENKARIPKVISEIRDLFPYDDSQWKEEIKRIEAVSTSLFHR